MMLALIEQIDKFRGLAGGLINHDWVTIPLVYTQVVTLAVYTFLLSTLMGRQFLNPVNTTQPVKINLKRKLDSKQKTSQTLILMAKGSEKQKMKILRRRK